MTTSRAPSRHAPRRARGRGLTVLEIMIVLAVIGMLSYLAYSGFRIISSAALIDDTNDLAAVLRRTQTLALETGEPVRVVFDLDKHTYWVEACVGSATMTRAKEEQKVDPETARKELEKAHDRLQTLPPGTLKAETPEQEASLAAALAGQQVGGKVCYPIDKLPPELEETIGKVFSGDADGRELSRKLQTGRGVKFKEIWVQHLEDSVTAGQVSISFFPLGWAEKAIIELGDGSSTHSLLLYGLTGRVEVRDGAIRTPDDHMMRNAAGESEAER
jgi:general secretion pathway protein H